MTSDIHSWRTAYELVREGRAVYDGFEYSVAANRLYGRIKRTDTTVLHYDFYPASPAEIEKYYGRPTLDGSTPTDRPGQG